MTATISIFELLAVMGSWWTIFATAYHAVSSRVEAYFQLDHESPVIDDIFTGFALVGIFSFLWLAPMILV
jgi:hypothetical protein